MATSTELPQAIDYFGKGHWLSRIQQRMSLKARRKMFDICVGLLKVESTSLQGFKLIDIGSTPDTEWIDSNCMIPWALELGMDVSLYSIENIQHLANVFSGVKILTPADEPGKLPGNDAEYNCVMASAVIEHVGSRANQVEFIRECGRVGKTLFLTTPNRGHWLEFHTKLPFLHWLPRKTFSAILRSLGKTFFASESNLRLLDQKELFDIAREALGPSFEIQCLSISSLGMRSNLILFARRMTDLRH